MVRRELRKLPEILGEREEVLNLARGEYDGKEGLLVVTDRRVVFSRAGHDSPPAGGLSLRQISSVQTKTGIRSGELTIFVSGNKATVKDVHPKQRAPEIGDYVRQRIAWGSTTSPSAAALLKRRRRRRRSRRWIS
jgi:Bacterial PH domain